MLLCVFSLSNKMMLHYFYYATWHHFIGQTKHLENLCCKRNMFSEDKIKILKFLGVKFKDPQTSVLWTLA